jgi:hypothetical protein
MRKVALTFITLLAGVCLAADDAAVTNASKTIALGYTAGVDAACATRVAEWLKVNLGPTRLVGELKAAAGEVPAKDILKASVSSNDVGLVLLIGGRTSRTVANAIAVESTVGSVYVDALATADANAKTNTELFLRRIDRAAIEAGALAVGMKPCLFFRCPLKPAETAAEFDTMSRNLCPPCKVKSESVLQSLGVHVEP